MKKIIRGFLILFFISLLVLMLILIFFKFQTRKAEVFCRDKNGRVESRDDGKKYCVLENGRWCELTSWYKKGTCTSFKCQCINKCGDGTCQDFVLMCCVCDQPCYENKEICPRDCK